MSLNYNNDCKIYEKNDFFCIVYMVFDNFLNILLLYKLWRKLLSPFVRKIAGKNGIIMRKN